MSQNTEQTPLLSNQQQQGSESESLLLNSSSKNIQEPVGKGVQEVGDVIYNSIDSDDNNNNNNNDNNNDNTDSANDNSNRVFPPSSTGNTEYEYNNNNNNNSNGGWINAVFGKIDPRIMSDLIIGLSDGLTVPFALTAGLSSLGDSKLVLLGGFAELISGTISMGLGGYLGAKSEADYYRSEVSLEKAKFFNKANRDLVLHDVEDILMEINPNFKEQTIFNFIKDLQREPELMLDFIIRFGKGLEAPGENRAVTSAVTIGVGYFFGGFIPLMPYFFVDHVGTGLLYSVVIMVFTLFCFGYIKAQLSMSDTCTFNKKIVEGLEMVAVGGVAAGAAWFFVKTLED